MIILTVEVVLIGKSADHLRCFYGLIIHLSGIMMSQDVLFIEQCLAGLTKHYYCSNFVPIDSQSIINVPENQCPSKLKNDSGETNPRNPVSQQSTDNIIN